MGIVKCSKCGIQYDSSKTHVCRAAGDDRESLFGSQETVKSGDGSNQPSS